MTTERLQRCQKVQLLEVLSVVLLCTPVYHTDQFLFQSWYLPGPMWSLLIWIKENKLQGYRHSISLFIDFRIYKAQNENLTLTTYCTLVSRRCIQNQQIIKIKSLVNAIMIITKQINGNFFIYHSFKMTVFCFGFHRRGQHPQYPVPIQCVLAQYSIANTQAHSYSHFSEEKGQLLVSDPL